MGVFGGGNFGGGYDVGAYDVPWRYGDRMTKAEHHHFPKVRKRIAIWMKDDAGKWRAVSSDEHRYEVVCAQCGDTDGPAEEQSPDVQTLRGPYRFERRAQRIADRHFADN